MSLSEPQCTSIAAVIVWYNPEPEYIDNIRTYASHVEHLIIVDNSDSDNAALLQGLNAHYVPFLANKGIAAALNRGVAEAENLGADWVLTMDQDSRFADRDMDAMLTAACELAPQPDIAAIGSIRTHSKSQSLPARKEVDKIITSGSLNRLSAIESIGGFTEKLFIDCVDFDFCHRLRRAGYRIILDRGIFLQHKLGDPQKAQRRGRDYVTRNHSPTRYYYQMRNNLYMALHFPEYRRQAKREIRLILRNVIFFETNKTRKLVAMAQGILHFLTGRYGPRNRS